MGDPMREARERMQTSTDSTVDRPAADRRAAAVPPDPNLAVCARGLTKHYVHPWTLRRTHGLDDLDLDVRRGEVLGLLGPNGAGKTTALKLFTGLLKPTRGRAWLLGQPVESPSSRCGLGFLPEQPYFYDYLNGLEYLELAARLSGLRAAPARERARHWLGRVGLGERPQLRLRKYSKGMLQRLGLAAALVHEPELLILDEPMSGLDPFGRRDVRELISEQRERGVTVLFSSHILPDVEMLCDRVAIVLGGRLTRVATVGELVEGGRQSVEIRCAPGGLLELPRGWAGLVSRAERADETIFRLEDESRLAEVLGTLLQARVGVRAVTPQRPTLEELFLAAAESERARRSA
jgi:ABC-2 type transport system ATP-binding protein